MKSRLLIVLGAFALLGGGVYLRGRLGAATDAAEEVPVIVTPKHRVTPRMLAGSALRSERPAPPFSATGSDGVLYALDDLLRIGPIVLVFIKDGCPCSDAAEPYFQGLHSAYDGRIRFFGVINGDLTLARRWRDEHGTTYPILADPDLSIIHAYGAENSAYVALVAADGRIEKLWPGYSAGMLRELGGRMARAARRKEVPFDGAGAPDEPYSGCPF